MISRKWAFYSLISILFFTAVSCDDDDSYNTPSPEPNTNTIVDIATSNDDFSTLVAALDKAGLVGVLEDQSAAYTVFAPSNAAFDALFADLGVSGLDELSAETLTPILLYHVLGFEAGSADVPNDAYLHTLATAQGDNPVSLYTQTTAGVVINGTVNVITADLEADNGVVHVIDEVLLPPTITEFAIANPNFTELVKALGRANLVDAVSSEGPFTVFAPTNAAFEALYAQLGVSSVEEIDVETLTQVLLYHVVAGNVREENLSSGDVETLNGESVTISLEDGATINGRTNITLTNVQGINGVVHAIDAVLLPETGSETNTIVDVALGDENFSTLVAALQKANLVEALQNPEGTFTVFAPTNAAFEALFADLGVSGLDELSAETLTPILLYHVLGTQVGSEQVQNGAYVSTLATAQDNALSLYTQTSEGVTLNGNTTVIIADLDADNGVIHAIDGVLLPPTVVDIAITNPNFSELVKAVLRADLAETLGTEGPFTVFAPTNAAFEALYEELGVSGIEEVEVETLTQILLYHVVSGNVREENLSAGEVETLNGSNIAIGLENGATINENTNIILTNVQGTNGVVHAIDAVLLP
ncbi:MAG: fasciclin domain-containing protein [Bacteroidota bacterium]